MSYSTLFGLGTKEENNSLTNKRFGPIWVPKIGANIEMNPSLIWDIDKVNTLYYSMLSLNEYKDLKKILFSFYLMNFKVYKVSYWI